MTVEGCAHPLQQCHAESLLCMNHTVREDWGREGGGLWLQSLAVILVASEFFPQHIQQQGKGGVERWRSGAGESRDCLSLPAASPIFFLLLIWVGGGEEEEGGRSVFVPWLRAETVLISR